MADIIKDTDLQGHLIQVRSEKNKIVLVADTDSPTSSVNEKTANLLVSTVKLAAKIKLGDNHEANRMVCYKVYKIPSFGQLIAPIESRGWTMQTTSSIEVDDRRANILGRKLSHKSDYNYTRRENQFVCQHFISTILTALTHKS